MNEMYYRYEKDYDSFEYLQKTKWMPPVKYKEASIHCA